jgi:amino acid transporter
LSKEAPPLFLRDASGLTRDIGPLGAAAACLGFTVGGGVHRLGYAFAYNAPGANITQAFLIVGFLNLFIMFSYGWLMVSMPRTGGDYIYVSRILNPAIAFLGTWGFYLALCLTAGILGYYSTETLGIILSALGRSINNPGVGALGYALSTNGLDKFTVSLILVVLSALVAFVGLRPHRWLINITVIIPILASLVMLYYLGTNNPTTTMAAWDANFGAGTAQKIIDLAHRTGYVDATYTTYSFSATLVSAAAPLWAWSGTPATIPAIGGEIKEIRRYAFGAVGLSYIFTAVYYPLLYYWSFTAYGPTFITQYIWDYRQQAAALSAIIPNPPYPNAATFAGYLSTNPFITAFMAIGVFFWMYNFIPPLYLFATRYTFAWSFDRIFPEQFAALHKKFNTPHWSILLALVIAIIGAYCSLAEEFSLWGASVAALDTTPLFDFNFVFTSVVAILLPFVRKDLYDLSFKVEIRKIPLISIIGVCSFLASLWLWVWSWNLLTLWPDLFFDVCLVTIGLLIYINRYIHLQNMGIDPKSIYAQIPPA